jgi:hypothetical protein
MDTISLDAPGFGAGLAIIRDRLRLRGIIFDQSQCLFPAVAELRSFSRHRLAFFPPPLVGFVGCFSAEHWRTRRSVFGANGRSGRANTSTRRVSCDNLYVRRRGGDQYVDLVCFLVTIGFSYFSLGRFCE